MPDNEKLNIALEALLELSNYADTSENSDVFWMRRIARDALCAIQRDHYLGTPSPVVAEVLAGVKL